MSGAATGRKARAWGVWGPTLGGPRVFHEAGYWAGHRGEWSWWVFIPVGIGPPKASSMSANGRGWLSTTL